MVNLTQSVQTKQISSIYQVEILHKLAEAYNEAFSVAFEIWKGNTKLQNGRQTEGNGTRGT